MGTRNNSWGVKAADAQGLHVSIVMKSGSLNLLEPYGPVQACNGNALSLLCFTKGRKAVGRIGSYVTATFSDQ
jgi:hypothetical protein